MTKSPFNSNKTSKEVERKIDFKQMQKEIPEGNYFADLFVGYMPPAEILSTDVEPNVSWGGQINCRLRYYKNKNLLIYNSKKEIIANVFIEDIVDYKTLNSVDANGHWIMLDSFRFFLITTMETNKT